MAIGKAGAEIDTRSATVRSQETAMGNLDRRRHRQGTGAQIGLTNGGTIRGNRSIRLGTPSRGAIAD